MLYVDEVASSEAEAIETALRKLRLDRKDITVRSVEEVDNGVKVRIEAVRSRGQEATDLLTDLLHRIGIKSELFYIESLDKVLINVKGVHLGLIIGKGGSTLEALEALLCAMHNRCYTWYKPVVINPGGYRENKRKALKTLVKRAVEAAGNGEKVSLPIMRQRDRKQVHQIIKEFPGYKSRSFGDDNDRRVFIYQAAEDEIESAGGLTEVEYLPTEDPDQSVYNDNTHTAIS